ncbi:CHAT domain-containing protein [Erythrobacter sp. HKB08]|uniref:CHAT domain-containing protein n=1 Tax=Erythrobacter sp. HKB08 TaxID=2502843 RepID=UPI001008E901|nr:CHAT domain-containing protein [Erythrobacter sp. HKB08]
MRAGAAITALLLAGTALPQTALGQGQDVLVRDSFPIGDTNGVLCQVQDRSVDNPSKQTMFDRRWAVVCRDSNRPVAEVFAYRTPVSDPVTLAASASEDVAECPAATSASRAGLSGLRRAECRHTASGLTYSVFTLDTDGMRYVARGFSVYDDATLLTLQSVVDNRIAEGTIDIATTSVVDPLSFARVQAGTLEPEQALWEGYRRNLGGEYAEAAAYFETLQERLEAEADATINPGEFLINRALQKSNLGQFSEANRLFSQAKELTAGDPVAGRLQRNFEAFHLLNQGFYFEAVDRVSRDLAASSAGMDELEGGLQITVPLSSRLNRTGGSAQLLGFVDELKLTPEERAEIIDAQALQLRGTGKRILGDAEGARRDFLDAYSRAIAVRDGRVTSIARMRAQVLGELAILAEQRGDTGTAETLLRNGLEILEIQYPERRAVSSAEARLAAFLLRQGREAEAMALYRDVIDRSVGKRNAVLGFANQLNPYYEKLAEQVDGDPQAASELFRALQVLLRPGVAETQAVLARELSANSDEGARLFRQSLDLGRDIERLRIRYNRLARAEQAAATMQQQEELAAQIDRLEQLQQQTQVRLNDFPQYRVVAPRALELSAFREALRPGEGYARLSLIGGDAFMFFTDRDTARAFKLDATEADLDFLVDMLRASISLYEGGQYNTYPYDLDYARELYGVLFEPLAAELAGVDHLIFEPDGALLRLPLDILVTDDGSIATYNARVEAGGDPFDFRGIAWFGRDRIVSTAVSAQSFVDARRVGGSSAGREYLGMGENAPIGDTRGSSIRAAYVDGSDDCGWNAQLWNQPIDDDELVVARQIVGEGQSEIITGQRFSDTVVKQKDDLDEFRVLHFATHGLVAPPRPECPARPALLTSFGEGESDGLLTFEEIFDLDLDADIVILSACDTAGEASIEATRAAGLTTGGGTSLDGLVRSFVGAGSRSVMASHWPAPDDYEATERLMTGMFSRARQADVGTALRQSQQLLMDDAVTSHPYYWGGFAIIGDATRLLLSRGPAQTADAAAAGNADGEAVLAQ